MPEYFILFYASFRLPSVEVRAENAHRQQRRARRDKQTQWRRLHECRRRRSSNGREAVAILLLLSLSSSFISYFSACNNETTRWKGSLGGCKRPSECNSLAASSFVFFSGPLNEPWKLYCSSLVMSLSFTIPSTIFVVR